jgi:hypothetical protein
MSRHALIDYSTNSCPRPPVGVRHSNGCCEFEHNNARRPAARRHAQADEREEPRRDWDPDRRRPTRRWCLNCGAASAGSRPRSCAPPSRWAGEIRPAGCCRLAGRPAGWLAVIAPVIASPLSVELSSGDRRNRAGPARASSVRARRVAAQSHKPELCAHTSTQRDKQAHVQAHSLTPTTRSLTRTHSLNQLTQPTGRPTDRPTDQPASQPTASRQDKKAPKRDKLLTGRKTHTHTRARTQITRVRVLRAERAALDFDCASPEEARRHTRARHRRHQRAHHQQDAHALDTRARRPSARATN